MASKEDLLAAVAQAGTKGAEAYQAAQQSITAQQGQAVAAALRGAAGANPEAQAQLSARVASGYSGRQAQLTQDAATSGDYFAKLGANANVYADQTAQLIPAIERRNELARQAKAASSGGGGSSGNEFTALAKQLGGYQNVQDYVRGLSKQQGDVSPVSDYGYSAQSIAAQLGVPEALASTWFPYSSADAEYSALGQKAVPSYKTVKEAKQATRQASRLFPGNQAALRKEIVQQVKKLKRGK